MAKELPYFKFEPSSWDNGNIQMCSRESKGLFMDLCSIYWQRLGELPYALALQKHCNGDKAALQDLEKNQIIRVDNGQIIIEFLDEQLSEFADVSDKRRKAAEKRWLDASALQEQSKSNAIRGEKIREDKKRKPLSTNVDGLKNEFEKSILSVIQTIKSEYEQKPLKEYKINPKRIRMIDKRKKEFHTAWGKERDFFKACQFAFKYKAKEWFGKDVWQHFIPETLLSDKFVGYLEKAEQDKGEPYVGEPKKKEEEKVVYQIPK